MDRATIYTKTDKSDRAVAASSEPAPGLDRILEAIDGKSSVEELAKWFDDLSAAELEVGLAALAEGNFIIDSTGSTLASGSPGPQSDESVRKAQELRAKIRERRQGGDRSRETPATDAWYKLRREREEKGKREAADRARQEAEEQVRRDAEEKIQREAAARSRQEAEEQARQAAEEQVRRDAEEEARKAAERARKEAEEQARREAEEEARREATERASQEAEEQAQRDAEEEVRKAAERARHDADAQDRLVAEEAARLEADRNTLQREKEARTKMRAKEKASVASKIAFQEWLRTWGKGLGLGSVAVILIGLGAIHLISFDGQIPPFEKALSTQFQQPVKIKSLHMSLIPRPQLRFEDVSIGGAGQIHISRADALGNLGSLFSERKEFKSIELESMSVTEEGLRWIMFGKQLARGVGLGQISVATTRFESAHVSVPVFASKIQLDEAGAWTGIAIESNDENLKLKLAPQGESVQFEIEARSFKIPFGSRQTLEDWTAKGTADRNGLSLKEFKGFIVGGFLSGSARLDWRANWSLTGDLKAKQMDVELLAPGVLRDARLAGTAVYSMQAAESTKLFASPRLEGNFVIERGTLLGVDMARMLQGRGLRGDTRFVDLTSGFVYEQGAVKLRQLHFGEGAMTASGSVDIDAELKVSGRLAVDLKLESDRRRTMLLLSGNSKKIDWDKQ